MKKTLAAVLAAMMALSTATVALAEDTDVAGEALPNIGSAVTVSTADNEPVPYGATSKFVLQAKEGTSTYLDELGRALLAKQIKIDATVTDGRSLLKKAPTVKVHEIKDDAGAVVGLRAVLYVDVKDTFNTDTLENDDTKEDIAMRIRITALEKCDLLKMAKGDTLSIDELTFNAYYNEITAYGKDMTITADEVKSNNVVVDAAELIEELADRETETATFYFGDVAAFTAKISEAQKDVNVHYETKVADAYYDEYPELDFEAIQFQASPKFLRKGTLTFNAIGDADTVVYEVTDEGLVKLERDEYDTTYGTVTIDGVNKLTSYLIASEALEDEAEVEEPAVEEPVEEENPKTGAC